MRWSWYNADTPDNLFEYSWNVTIGDDDSGFQFGPALFKPSESQIANGSLNDLLSACQHDLWLVSKDGGENIGGFEKTNIEDGKVRKTITDRKLIERLFESRPKTLHMMITTPEFMIRQRTEIKYEE